MGILQRIELIIPFVSNEKFIVERHVVLDVAVINYQTYSLTCQTLIRQMDIN